MMTSRELAEVGYKAYAKSTNNKNYQGKEMPSFDELPPAIQNAWCVAALAITAADV